MTPVVGVGHSSNLVDMSCRSSSSCNIVPRERGLSSSKRTSSTTKLSPCRTHLSMHTSPPSAPTPHPMEAEAPDHVLFASFRDVQTTSWERIFALFCFQNNGRVYSLPFTLIPSCMDTHITVNRYHDYCSYTLVNQSTVRRRSGRRLSEADLISDPR